jgi:SAM-dependent methyltransferase
MIIDNQLLSFRYKKSFFLNRYKFNKIESISNKIKRVSHSFCPICFNKEFSLISEVDRVGFPCDTVVCLKCEFVFNNSYMSNPTEYYENQFGKDSWGDPEKSFINRTSAESFSLKRFLFLKEKLGENFSKINKVLEVGCGDGCNLFHYHLIGKEVMGCDFDRKFLKPGRTRGMNLIEGDLKCIPESLKFDLIMIIHAFTHVIDIDEMVHQIGKRLKPGGLVYVEVPGIVNWNFAKKFKKSEMGLCSSNNFLNYIQFQHNYHFDLSHLKCIWERNMFEMTEGDEWVRAIFKIKSIDKINQSEINSNFSTQNIKQHLKNSEVDFLSVSNLTQGLIKKLYRKFFGR